MLLRIPSRSCWLFAALVCTFLWTLVACTSVVDRPSLELGSWELLLPNDSIWVEATVPGDVMLDLQRHGLLPNPFHGTHERDVQWVEQEDWTYRSVLPKPTVWQNQGIQHPVLHFPGLDTYASVFLDDSLVATTNNAYRSCRIPIAAGSDPCTLKVVLHSPVQRGLEELDGLPRVVPVSNEMKPIGSQTSAVTRKPAFQFGWDWAPRLASAGITQTVRIEDLRQPGRADARIDVALRGDSLATITAQETGVWPDGAWTLYAPNGSPLEASGRGAFTVDNPELWWPNGMGEQPLYRLVWEPHEAGCHRVEWRLGIRELTWKREPDAWGHSFECHVNGQRIQARGANVIPGDYFTARALERDTALLKQALEANMNMVRVWGGASYPSDGYFDFCDREGILVWQDFMFACMMVAGDSAFFDNVEQEAREQVARLQAHPSLALWCGNNESQRAWETWGWQDMYDLHGEDSIATAEDYWSMFHELLPAVVAEHSNTEYWPSSPTHDWALPERVRESGDDHAWHVWFDTLDFSHFSEHRGRFASEYGLQSLPHVATLREAGIRKFKDEALQFRQRSSMEWLKPGLDGWGMMRIYARRYTADPAARDEVHPELDRWIYLTQLTQALGIREALERHRASSGKYAGSLYWQLNDVWPTVSWSTVDHAGRWKLAHHAARRANQPRRVLPDRTDSRGRRFVMSNSSPEAISGSQLTFVHRSLDGRLTSHEEHEISLGAFNDAALEVRHTPSPQTVTSWVWTDSKGRELDRGERLHAKPAELPWPRATVQVQIQSQANELALTTDSLAYGVRLSTDVPGRFSDNGFMLFPDEKRQITFLPDEPGRTLAPLEILVEHFAEFQRP